ncbi:MAG: CBS domain-containing protein [Clostridia bacterium]|nr:CBS domain-containing protein [Clostridia bacterium]
MANADIFLNLYKDLEELLEVKYSNGKKFTGSAVMRYYNDDEGKKWREELNICREMRNMLSHHAKIGGKAVFEPSDEVVKILRQIIDDVKNPPVAMTIATPADKLFTCGYDDLVEDVVHVMKAEGYSHVPVVENGRLVGVFSVSTVFALVDKYGIEGISKCCEADREYLGRNTTISRFREFLPIDRHVTESFGFVADSSPYSSLQRRFGLQGAKSLRLVALFVTENGRAEEKLLGMITPWDMIREK